MAVIFSSRSRARHTRRRRQNSPSAAKQESYRAWILKRDGLEDQEPGAAFQVEALVQRLQQLIDLALLLCKERG